MKMEHALTAPFDGTVAELNADAGRSRSPRADAGEGRSLNQAEPR